MTRFLILLLAIGIPLLKTQPTLLAFQGAGSDTDRGVFRIQSDGQPIGTERFEITPSGDGLRVTGELNLNVSGVGRMTETSTLALRGGVEPVNYERVQKSPKRQSILVTFDGKKADAQYRTAEAGNQQIEFFVPRDVVVLDTNFFHHYTFLVRRYDFLTGGRQHVNILIPQEATPGMISLEYAGADQSLRKLVARTDELEIEIWADEAGRVMKLNVPAAKVEVVRETR